MGEKWDPSRCPSVLADVTCQVGIPGAFKRSMRPETRESMEKLFTAKWNVPKAAENCNLSWKEMKITFNEYCAFHPPTYDENSD